MGRVPDMWASPTQGEPLEALAKPGACPVLEIAGTADQWVPAADLEALETVGVEVVRYEGADHGFVHDPDRRPTAPTTRPTPGAGPSPTWPAEATAASGRGVRAARGR